MLRAAGGDCGGGSETLVAHTLTKRWDSSEDGCGRGTPMVAHCLNAHPSRRIDGESETFVPVTFAHQGGGKQSTLGFDAESGTSPTLISGQTPSVAFTFDERQITSQANRTRVGPGLPCGTLYEMPHAVAFQERGQDGGRGVEWQEDLAYSLNAPSGGGRRHEMNIATRWAVRRLTPTECERLQGFPDGWTLVSYRGKPAKDCPRYKAIGNSMPVNVMRWIGRRIEMVESLEI